MPSIIVSVLAQTMLDEPKRVESHLYGDAADKSHCVNNFAADIPQDRNREQEQEYRQVPSVEDQRRLDALRVQIEDLNRKLES